MFKSKPSKLFISVLLMGAAAVIALLLFFFYFYPKDMRNDYKQLAQNDYELAFLSMYPIDNYRSEGFNRRYGVRSLITSHEIPNLSTLEGYLEKIAENNNAFIVYLGILPEKINGDKLAELLLSYPEIEFKVLLPYPSMDYWLSQSTDKCSRILQGYRDCITALTNQPSIELFSFTEWEWLVSNPANYEDTFLTTEEISEYIMYHTDTDLEYYVHDGTGNVDTLAALIERYRTAPPEYAELTNWNIVFFGDSVIGNYTNTTSVPHVTGALTGANVYNLGYGGTCMTEVDAESFSMPDITAAFIQQKPDLLPADSQAHLGIGEYLTAAPQGRHCFVINYGLNDYFSGQPLSSEDPYDIHTFTGAARTSIKMLREAYPDAYILLNTPNFNVLFDNGTEVHSSFVLEDYVNTLKELAVELDVALLDIYGELGINEENAAQYLADGCHPNETGRFLIGQAIAEKMREISP